MYSQGSVVIVEEPAPKLKRFRYLSEGKSAPLEGVNTTKEKKTYPSIKIVNYTGKATIVVSCVTEDKPYRQHPHELVGKNCVKGVCYISNFSTDSKEPTILSFPELRIQCSKVSEIAERLNERKRLNINPFDLSKYKDNFKRDIHTVRLCFQVIIKPDPENPKQRIQFKPIVSQPITNNKDATELKIHDISDACSSASGGKKIMIFCNKISKEDIQLRFFTEDAEKKEIWVGWGKFQCRNVHRDVAIAFTTPKYELKDIDSPQNTFVELLRPSDNAKSNRIPFQYFPDVTNIDVTMRRKQHKVNESNNFFQHLGALPHINFPNNQRQRSLERQHEQFDPPQRYYPEKEHIVQNPQTNIPPQVELQAHNPPQTYNSLQQYQPQQYQPQYQYQPQQYQPQQYQPQQCHAQQPNEVQLTAFENSLPNNPFFQQEDQFQHKHNILLPQNDYCEEDYSMRSSNDIVHSEGYSFSHPISNINLQKSK